MNLTLIGMPCVGKSTIGKALAERKHYGFIDIDTLIEQQQKKKLQEIIDELGDEEFLSIEKEIILSLSYTNTIISPGGSVIYCKKTMDYLKDISIIIYLFASYETIEKKITKLPNRGIVGLKEKGLREVYNERASLYDTYADITIDILSYTVIEDIMQKCTLFPRYVLLRTDDNGHCFLMKDDLTKTAAEKFVDEYTTKGHKQHYTMHAYRKKELTTFLKKKNVHY